MSKVNILVVPSDRTGVGKFRSLDPHIKLEELFPDDFHVEINYEPNWNDDNYLKQFQIVHYHRTLPIVQNNQIRHIYGEAVEKVVQKLRGLGIKTIMDLDDYWDPTKDHPSYHIIRNNGLHTKIPGNLRYLDYVTTTTPIFADEIKKINKNVVVIPNAIDPTEKQFQPKDIESDKIRIGWLGGSSHLQDLEIVRGTFNKLSSDRELRKQIQVVVCGFDTRGTITQIDNKTGEQKQRKITPQESVWCRYEEIFTNNYKLLGDDKDYIKELNKFTKGISDSDKSYRRVWTEPVTTFATNYNLFDISLAPIKDHMFNKVKSQLKVIEAGFHKKALIAQDYGPYTIDLKDAWKKGGGFNDDGNALLVHKDRNHKGWYQSVKRLIDNPSMITELGERLYETVSPRYHIDKVTTDRAEFYKSILD